MANPEDIAENARLQAEAEDNPDFIECAGCGGEFYKGDLKDELCEDCYASSAGEDDIISTEGA